MRLLPAVFALILLVCGSVRAETATAAPPAVPTVVEVFTSKYCPNCPAVEKQLRGIADEDRSLLVVFEHVDYWDQGERKDPFGSADITQRQYDYSNSVSRRPGEVFTPMPLLNGKYVANMPMWLNWKSTLAKAKAAQDTLPLAVTRSADGDLKVVLPKNVKAKGVEITVLGVVPDEESAARRLKGLLHVDVQGPTVAVPAALLPKTDELVILLQKDGPQGLLAMAWVKK